jgi:hypothetical protein
VRLHEGGHLRRQSAVPLIEDVAVAMPLLPGFHPRMVSVYYGPTPNRRLQPTGFFALNYGNRTPIVTVAAHVLYGAIIGEFYELATR